MASIVEEAAVVVEEGEEEPLPHFKTPMIYKNIEGWGPTTLPQKFCDVPYQPFGKVSICSCQDLLQCTVLGPFLFAARFQTRLPLVPEVPESRLGDYRVSFLSHAYPRYS